MAELAGLGRIRGALAFSGEAHVGPAGTLGPIWGTIALAGDISPAALLVVSGALTLSGEARLLPPVDRDSDPRPRIHEDTKPGSYLPGPRMDPGTPLTMSKLTSASGRLNLAIKHTPGIAIPTDRAADASGNERHATYSSSGGVVTGVNLSTPSLLDNDNNGSATFSGGYVDLAGALADLTGSFTVEMIVRPDTTGTYYLFDAGDNATDTDRLLIYLNGAQVRWSTKLYERTYGSAIVAGVKVHLVFTFDVASRTSKCYVDGGLLGSFTDLPVGYYDATLFAEGAYLGSSGGVNPFPGPIDEFAIYQGILPDSAIARHASEVGGSGYSDDVLAGEASYPPYLYLRLSDTPGEPGLPGDLFYDNNGLYGQIGLYDVGFMPWLDEGALVVLEGSNATLAGLTVTDDGASIALIDNARSSLTDPLIVSHEPVTGVPGFDPDAGGALPTGLQAYWPLEEASGDVTDVIAALVGTNTGTTSVAGIQGNGRTFAGAEYVTIPQSTRLDLTAEWTLSVWIRPTNVASIQTVATKGASATSGAHQWILYISGNANGDIYLFTPSGDAYTAGGVLTANVWHHIVITLTGGTTPAIWLNGVSQTITDTITAAATIISDSTVLGRHSAGVGRYFTGRIDEPGIWNRKLTNAEIADLYNAGAGNTYHVSLSVGAGVGTGILLRTFDDADALTDVVRYGGILTDPTAGSEDSAAVIYARTAGGVLTEVARFSAGAATFAGTLAGGFVRTPVTGVPTGVPAAGVGASVYARISRGGGVTDSVPYAYLPNALNPAVNSWWRDDSKFVPGETAIGAFRVGG